MKRCTLRILFLLILGGATTVAVAWACALWSPEAAQEVSVFGFTVEYPGSGHASATTYLAEGVGSRGQTRRPVFAAWGSFANPHGPAMRASGYNKAMNLSEITIRVQDDLAAAYRAASEEDRRKIDLLLALRLGEALQPHSSLGDVVRRIAARARERGMNEDILKTLLNGE